MFLATHSPSPPSPSLATSLTEDYADPQATPAIKAALQHIDRLFKRAIFGPDSVIGGATADTPLSFSIPFLSSVDNYLPTLDALLTHLTTVVFFSLLFLVLLSLKLLLGMALLSLARRRYAGMKAREKESSTADSKRFGGWGMVETGDERRKWIYEDDPEGLRRVREREEKDGKGGEGRKEGRKLDSVERYAMVGKRIW